MEANMADITFDPLAAQHAEALRLRRTRNIAATREAYTASELRGADGERQAAEAARERQALATDSARRLDTEQRLRDQQLAADLKRIEEDRLDAERSPERGAVVDILA